MSINVAVLYPNVSDATFNMDYYLKSHMPLVQEKFGAHGMKAWKIQKMTATPSGDSPPYSVQAILEFDSSDQVEAAMKNAGEPVMGDIPNFSNQQPIIMVGEVVGQS